MALSGANLACVTMRPPPASIVSLALLTALAPVMAGARLPALAMCAAGDVPPTLASAWSPTWWLLPGAAWALAYAVGLAALWHRAGVGRGIGVVAAAAFWLGAGVVALATLWPLHALGEWSLAAHMAQHMLLLALAPPLLLAGRPVAAVAHALPQAWAGRLHRACAPLHRALAGQLGAASVAHGAVMALWHFPGVITLAMSSTALHLLMHVSFLAAGLWFWMAAWQRIREPAVGAGAGVIALVSMMMVMGFTGALLTFAPRLLYPVYAIRAPQVGLDPLIDQQLAGLLMWVPSCLPYLAGGLWLIWRGMAHAQQRAAATSAAPVRAP